MSTSRPMPVTSSRYGASAGRTMTFDDLEGGETERREGGGHPDRRSRLGELVGRHPRQDEAHEGHDGGDHDPEGDGSRRIVGRDPRQCAGNGNERRPGDDQGDRDPPDRGHPRCFSTAPTGLGGLDGVRNRDLVIRRVDPSNGLLSQSGTSLSECHRACRAARHNAPPAHSRSRFTVAPLSSGDGHGDRSRLRHADRPR